MVSKLVLFLSLFTCEVTQAANVPMAANVQNLGGVAGGTNPAVTYPLPSGGPANYITLTAGWASGTDNRRFGLYKYGTQYKVTSGKTLRCFEFYASAAGGTAYTTNIQFGDNSATFSNNTAKGAGDTYYGASSTNCDGGCVAVAFAQATANFYPYSVDFQGNVYPWVSPANASTSNSGLLFHCFEF